MQGIEQDIEGLMDAMAAWLEEDLAATDGLDAVHDDTSRDGVCDHPGSSR